MHKVLLHVVFKPYKQTKTNIYYIYDEFVSQKWYRENKDLIILDELESYFLEILEMEVSIKSTRERTEGSKSQLGGDFNLYIQYLKNSPENWVLKCPWLLI